MPDLTPGQVAYTAYGTTCARLPDGAARVAARWTQLPLAEQMAWEAAAQAVLDAAFPPLDLSLEEDADHGCTAPTL